MSWTWKDTSLGEHSYVSNYAYNKDNNGAILAVYGDPVAQKWNSSKKGGLAIPHFHQRRAAGELLPHTPYVQHVANAERSSHYLGYTDSGYSTYSGAPTIGDHTWYYSMSEMQEAFAPGDLGAWLQVAADRIYDSSYDALTAISELPETLRMIYNLAYRLIKFRRQAGNLDLANAWLEYRYGWRTLAYDILELNQVLSDDWKRKRFTERAGTRSTTTSVTTYDVNPGAAIATMQRTENVSVGLRASVTADYSPDKFSFNPLVTGWEIIPYSFVIDWLVNIGRALSVASFVSTVEAYTASTGYIIENHIEWEIVSYEFDPQHAVHTSGTLSYRADYDVTLKVRSPAQIPISPYFRLNLDISKIADILALIKQLVR